MDPRTFTRAVGSIFLNRDAYTGTRVESSCDTPSCHIARATLHVGDFFGASPTVVRRRWTPSDGCNAGQYRPNPKKSSRSTQLLIDSLCPRPRVKRRLNPAKPSQKTALTKSY